MRKLGSAIRTTMTPPSRGGHSGCNFIILPNRQIPPPPSMKSTMTPLRAEIRPGRDPPSPPNYEGTHFIVARDPQWRSLLMLSARRLGNLRNTVQLCPPQILFQLCSCSVMLPADPCSVMLPQSHAQLCSLSVMLRARAWSTQLCFWPAGPKICTGASRH